MNCTRYPDGLTKGVTAVILNAIRDRLGPGGRRRETVLSVGVSPARTRTSKRAAVPHTPNEPLSTCLPARAAAESVFKLLQDSWRVSGNVDVTAGRPGCEKRAGYCNRFGRAGGFFQRQNTPGFEISRLVQNRMDVLQTCLASWLISLNQYPHAHQNYEKPEHIKWTFCFTRDTFKTLGKTFHFISKYLQFLNNNNYVLHSIWTPSRKKLVIFVFQLVLLKDGIDYQKRTTKQIVLDEDTSSYRSVQEAKWIFQ